MTMRLVSETIATINIAGGYYALFFVIEQNFTINRFLVGGVRVAI